MKPTTNTTTPAPKPDAQPVQAASSTRLIAALEAIHEAGRMSSQPRAVYCALYCALIAEDALVAAKGGAQ
jgi:hypothetical protein